LAEENTIEPKLEARYGFQGLRFEELRYPSGFRLPSHTHEHAFLDLCLSGTIQEDWGRQTFVRGPLTLSYLPIGAPHGACFGEEVKTLQIVLPASWLERVGQGAPLVDTLTRYEEGLPIWIVMRLYREFQRRDDLSSLVLEGMLLELLAEMSRHSADRFESGSPPWLRQAKDYLHAHFTASFSVDTVAAAVGVHPSHLMRSFRHQHRCTIGDYIRRLRVEYACHLLSASDAPLAQIALAAGFADQSHFNQTFKSFTGMTPTEFQKAAGYKKPLRVSLSHTK
jgi:AraC family transcriptional regulator